MWIFRGERGLSLKETAISILGKLIPKWAMAPYLHFFARIVIRTRKPYIVGITGSVGKTTTTEMIASVLRHPDAERIVGRVGSPVKNMNDDVGLPATILLFDKFVEDYPPSRLATAWLAPWRALRIAAGIGHYPKLFVLEFGTSWDGHIARLAQLAPPDIAVVTTIGAAHLERLKTLEGVAQEKMSLVRAVPPSGLVILGSEHDFVPQLAQAARAPVVLVPGRGAELSENATRAICKHLLIRDQVVAAGLRDFKPPQGRLNILRLLNMTVIDDSYNANPLSMKFGLDTLARTATSNNRKVAVLGFMAELGEHGTQYHKEIGAYARSRSELLIGIGELAKHYDADYWFESSEACAEHIGDLLRANDCILIKGSGSARTRKVVEKLRQIAVPAP